MSVRKQKKTIRRTEKLSQNYKGIRRVKKNINQKKKKKIKTKKKQNK